MLTIDPEFESILKPLDKETRDGLKAMIQREGVLFPLMYWESDGQKILIDGHSRYEIAMELGVGFPAKPIKFESRDDAKAWIRAHQANRRNVTKGELAVLRGREYLAAKKSDEEKSKMGVKARETTCTQNGNRQKPSESQGERTAEKVAKKHGVGKNTIIRDAERAEIHDTVRSADPVSAKDVLVLPQKEVAEIKKATKDVPEPQKPKAVAEEVRKRVAKPKPEPIVIEGACDELIQLVASGAISVKVAENLIEQVPGEGTQAKIVSQGSDAVKRAASKPREEKPKAPPKVTESQVLAFLQDADAETKARIVGKVFSTAEPDERKAIFHKQQRTFSETERFKLIDWAREQNSNLESEMTAREINIISERSKVPINQRHRISLVKKLLQNPTNGLKDAVRMWVHENFVGKQSIFVPPTLDEVERFAATLDEKKYPHAKRQGRIDRFFNFYEKKGWIIGSRPMSSWKAAYRDSLKWEADGTDRESTGYFNEETIPERKARIAKEDAAKIASGEIKQTFAEAMAERKAKREAAAQGA